jgi:hypothetical protein
VKGRVKTLLDTVVRPAGYIVGGGLLLVRIRLVDEGLLRDAQRGFVLGMLLLILGLISLATAAALVGNYAAYLQTGSLRGAGGTFPISSTEPARRSPAGGA